jgi:hypothetical protein
MCRRWVQRLHRRNVDGHLLFHVLNLARHGIKREDKGLTAGVFAQTLVL